MVITRVAIAQCIASLQRQVPGSWLFSRAKFMASVQLTKAPKNRQLGNPSATDQEGVYLCICITIYRKSSILHHLEIS